MPEAEVSKLEGLLKSGEATAALDALLGSTPTGVIVVSAQDRKVLRFSDYAARLIKRPRSDIEGVPLAQAFERLPAYYEPGRPVPVNERGLTRALRGETVTGFEFWRETADGELIPCVSNTAPIRDARGEVIGAITSMTNLRQQKALERSLREALAQREEAVSQREALYRELTHRVKNHLQIMTVLITLEGRKPALTAKALADEMVGKLQALAAVYKGMDRAEVGERISARTFVEGICRTYASDTVRVEAEVAPSDLCLASEQAGAIGMLINEAVCNCRKHAFPGGGGHVRVSLRRLEPGRLRLEVADDGVGWGVVDPGETHHGLDLMRLFAQQLHSKLELGVHRPGGAVVAVEIVEPVT